MLQFPGSKRLPDIASEFHDLAELALNEDGQSWGNLGYWKDADSYSAACRDLALLLGEAACLDQDSRVFDAGFGCGDQLLLWLEQFQVATVCGLNYSKSQTEIAHRQLSDAGREEAAKTCVFGDACDKEDWARVVSPNGIDRVLALDCAYHFADKQSFFGLAHQYLEKGGRLALTDFVFSAVENGPFWRDTALSTMLKLSHIPTENMKADADYRLQLSRIGFANVEMIDISEHVMPGFLKWLRPYKTKSLDNLASLQWLKYDITARFLGWAYREDLLRYYLITADKE